MKRFLAMCAVVMCLAACMVPMAFADDVVWASSDVRIAGFSHGLSTLDPSADATRDEYGGVFVHGDITCKSVSVSDLQWRSAEGGYFYVSYTIDVEPIAADAVLGDVVASVPLEWTSGMRVEYSVATLSDMWTTGAITVKSSSSTHLGLGLSDMQLYSITDDAPYVADCSGSRMLKAYWFPTTADAVLTRIHVMVKVWVPDATVVTTVSGGTDFGSWLTYPFRLVSAGGGAILAFFKTVMNAPLIAPIIGVTGSTLLMSIIISIVR